jgi:hypothetical protein
MLSKTLRVRLDAETVARLEFLAETYQLTVSAFIRAGVRAVLADPDAVASALLRHDDTRTPEQQDSWEQRRLELEQMDMETLLTCHQPL